MKSVEEFKSSIYEKKERYYKDKRIQQRKLMCAVASIFIVALFLYFPIRDMMLNENIDTSDITEGIPSTGESEQKPTQIVVLLEESNAESAFGSELFDQEKISTILKHLDSFKENKHVDESEPEGIPSNRLTITVTYANDLIRVYKVKNNLFIDENNETYVIDGEQIDEFIRLIESMSMIEKG